MDKSGRWAARVHQLAANQTGARGARLGIEWTGRADAVRRASRARTQLGRALYVLLGAASGSMACHSVMLETGSAALTMRAPSLKNVAAVCPVLWLAMRASQNVDSLTVIGAGEISLSHHGLTIPIFKPDIGSATWFHCYLPMCWANPLFSDYELGGARSGLAPIASCLSADPAFGAGSAS